MLEELMALAMVAEREAEFQRYLRERGARWHGLPAPARATRTGQPVREEGRRRLGLGGLLRPVRTEGGGTEP